jgi:hypothetical protein
MSTWTKALKRGFHINTLITITIWVIPNNRTLKTSKSQTLHQLHPFCLPTFDIATSVRSTPIRLSLPT